jgi:hypothetical protein
MEKQSRISFGQNLDNGVFLRLTFRKQGNSCVAVKFDARTTDVVRALRSYVDSVFRVSERMRRFYPLAVHVCSIKSRGRYVVDHSSGIKCRAVALTRSLLAFKSPTVCRFRRTNSEQSGERTASLEALVVLLIKVITS